MPSAIVWKPIMPKSIKPDAARLAVLSGLHKAEREIKKDFQKTTQTWKHAVRFDSSISTRGGTARVEVGTSDEIYGYVDQGTQPHEIRPKRAKMLRFQSQFRAKTRPGYITSYRGYRGGPAVYRSSVMHPGSKAREFAKTIARRWQPRFNRIMRDAMKAAAQKSGHGVR